MRRILSSGLMTPLGCEVSGLGFDELHKGLSERRARLTPRTWGRQWQEQPPPQQPPPAGMLEATGPPSLLTENSDSVRFTLPLPQVGHAAIPVVEAT